MIQKKLLILEPSICCRCNRRSEGERLAWMARLHIRARPARLSVWRRLLNGRSFPERGRSRHHRPDLSRDGSRPRAGRSRSVQVTSASVESRQAALRIPYQPCSLLNLRSSLSATSTLFGTASAANAQVAGTRPISA